MTLLPLLFRIYSAMGNGTESAPFLIATFDDLKNIRKHPSSHYALIADIDASPTHHWNDAGSDSSAFEGWIPFRFSGTLDGRGHKIKHLTIQRPNQDGVGLFSTISVGKERRCPILGVWNGSFSDVCNASGHATVKNLEIQADSIVGRDRVGVLAGEARNALIRNCTVSGALRGRDNVGGFAGAAGPWAAVVSSRDSLNISGRDDVGGLFGSMVHSRLDTVRANGRIDGRDRVGGAAGSAYGSRLRNIVSNAMIFGRDSVAGVLGLSIGSLRGERQLSLLTKVKPPTHLLGYDSPQDGNFSYLETPWSGPGKYPESKIAENLPVDTRVSHATYQGELHCNRWCGGIRGGTRDYPFSLVRCINSGLIHGKSHVGGLSGSSRDLTRHISLVQAGLVWGDSSAGLFGDSAAPISDVFIASPSGARISCRDLFVECDPLWAAGSVGFGRRQWTTSVYPDGLWGFEGLGEDFGLARYLQCDRQFLAHRRMMFWETPTSTRHYTYEGRDVSVNTLSNKLESVGEKFSTDVLPPIRRSGLQGLPEKGCVNLAKTYLHGTYSSSSLRFSLLAPNESYEIKGDSICRTSASPSTAPDSVILEVRATEGGLLRSFMRKSVATSVDTSQFLQACPLWPKEQP